MKSTHDGFAQALSVAGKRKQALVAPNIGSRPRRSTGSSAPAPKGTPAEAAATSVVSHAELRESGCAGLGPKHAGLSDAAVPELRKLAQYEQLCGGAVAARSSIFVPTPSTVAQASTSANTVAATLKAFSTAGVRPLVFMEPADLNGAQLNLSAYATGAYDTALNDYFQTLQATGITSAEMGMWVYLPEGNLPVWSTTDPSIYASVVVKMAELQKQYFPGSLASLMLDSQSFPAGSSWGGGRYASLLPYVQSIPKGLIDSFGLQGFPWAAPADRPHEVSLYNPKVYLRTDFAVQAARALGTKDIWFNTGTFATMYADKPGQTVADTPPVRQEMLDGVLQLARQTQASGFNVSIHLFAQDKASWAEATDWSYWRHTPGDRPDTAVFTTFAHDAKASGIALWLYDSF